jgi:hypothetical protein
MTRKTPPVRTGRVLLLAISELRLRARAARHQSAAEAIPRGVTQLACVACAAEPVDVAGLALAAGFGLATHDDGDHDLGF